MVNDQITGSIILDRYLIGRLIDKGDCGNVYKVTDLKDKKRALVIKISTECKQIAKEI